MKLLIDENLSPRLVLALNEEFPDSAHVEEVLGRRAPDETIWNYARANDFVILTRDTGFPKRSSREGHPPKVIFAAVGNVKTAHVTSLLLRESERLRDFEESPVDSCFVLS